MKTTSGKEVNTNVLKKAVVHQLDVLYSMCQDNLAPLRANMNSNGNRIDCITTPLVWIISPTPHRAQQCPSVHKHLPPSNSTATPPTPPFFASLCLSHSGLLAFMGLRKARRVGSGTARRRTANALRHALVGQCADPKRRSRCRARSLSDPGWEGG